MIQITNLPQGAKVLELGGAGNRHPVTTCCVDIRPGPDVDFSCDFNDPLPLKDDEWDLVLCQYCLEHLSWRRVRGFLKEVFRVVKTGGHVIFTVPNTEAQIAWAKAHPNGWDGRDAFDSISGVLYGDQDYPDNTHKLYMSPTIAQTLFSEAGFSNVLTSAYGERDTDLAIRANKAPQGVLIPDHLQGAVDKLKGGYAVTDKGFVKTTLAMPREEMYDKHYFNGGGKVGGYAREGYWDYPIHHVTAQHILARRPESVLEIGCARGYVLKRIQDAGIPGVGLEISKHCYLTRVCDHVILHDICNTSVAWPEPWVSERPRTVGKPSTDLCYSVATLEHIPEEFLPHIISEMARTCKRGLHGIDFGGHDDGFDRTHCTLRPKEWWLTQFDRHARGWPVEIVDKESLEQGTFPEAVLKGDGKVKLNIGSFTTMTHYGWINIDVHDLAGFAQANGYRYQQCDVRNGLPYATGSVDLIASCHMLEHLTYKEGLAFLRECRRVLKPESGGIRIIVPDAGLLMNMYANECEGEGRGLGMFDEINDGCAEATTPAGKLWALLHEGHHACYDSETLERALIDAGFIPYTTRFRVPIIFLSRENGEQPIPQIIRETLEMIPCLSLAVDAIPLIV